MSDLVQPVSTPKSAARDTANAGKIKRPKPARGEALGILNPWGDLWTFETFRTEAEARAYLAAFWRQPCFRKAQPDLSKYTVIPVKVTVSAK